MLESLGMLLILIMHVSFFNLCVSILAELNSCQPLPKGRIFLHYTKSHLPQLHPRLLCVPLYPGGARRYKCFDNDNDNDNGENATVLTFVPGEAEGNAGFD